MNARTTCVIKTLELSDILMGAEERKYQYLEAVIINLCANVVQQGEFSIVADILKRTAETFESAAKNDT